MIGAVELQIGLGWNESLNGFDVTLHAATDDEIISMEMPSRALEIDLAALRPLIADQSKYATAVTDLLFGIEGLRDKFIEMLTLAEERNVRLHVRLLLDRTAPAEYHTVRWELLRDPRTEQPLALDPEIAFSRFVNPRFSSGFSLRARGELRALIVAVEPHPESFQRYGLEAIDARKEADKAKVSLGAISTTVVCERGKGTLRMIASILKEAIRGGNPYSIVYVIAHGALHEQGPVLYLENEEGNATPVAGSSFIAAVTELEIVPSLILLASCETASSGVEAASMGESATALGPALVSDGIPAVVAMHGSVTVRTVESFVPRFFEELEKSGSVYDALLEGRKSVRDRPDWWAPTLFTRLRTGRIFRAPSRMDQKWGPTKTAIVDAIEQGRCTPIVGPGLSAGFFPARQMVAKGLAARLQVPIAPGSSYDLARISQYLVATHRDRMYPRSALINYLIERIVEDHGLTDNELQLAAERAGARRGNRWLTELVVQLGRKHRDEHPEDDPFAVLAAMNFPIYFTTSYTTFLEDALEAAGKRPRIVDLQAPPTRGPILLSDDADSPIVVRLFGGFANPNTLVLTEDDYFNYLTTWATSRSVSLRGLQSNLTNQNLLLVGFGLDDWDFRVLFRSILSMEGANVGLRNLAHVAVQVNPESETIEPDAIQQYLEQYYDHEANFSLRWGTPSEFLRELRA